MNYFIVIKMFFSIYFKTILFLNLLEMISNNFAETYVKTKFPFFFSFFHNTIFIKITFGKIFCKLILLHYSVNLVVFIKFL